MEISHYFIRTGREEEFLEIMMFWVAVGVYPERREGRLPKSLLRFPIGAFREERQEPGIHPLGVSAITRKKD